MTAHGCPAPHGRGHAPAPGLPWARTLAALATALACASAGADLADTIDIVRRSVVPVGTYKLTDSPRFGFRGTGFVVGDGTLIVTNAHVLPDDAAAPGTQMAVLPPRSSGAPTGATAQGRFARVEAVDRQRDLALLRLQGEALPALQLDDAGRVREGQAVALMGFPVGGVLGYAAVTHRGIVASITTLALPAQKASQLDPRAVSRLREGNFEVLQLDATAYPGNSGGPVFDAATGRVVGVVNMVLVKSTRESALAQPTGITYAIPARQVRALIDESRAAAPSR